MSNTNKTERAKGKRRPSCSARIPTSDPKVNIHVTWPDKLDSNIKVRAYPVDEKGIRIPGILDSTKIARAPEEIPLIQEELREIVLDKMHPKTKPKIKSRLRKGELDEDTPAVQAFQKLEKSDIKIGRWGEESQKKALQYFRRNTLADIQYCLDDEDFGPDQREELHQKFKEAAFKHGNSKNNIAKAEEVASGHMADAGIIYGAMMAIDERLPYLSLLNGERKKAPQTEQIKMIPINIHIKFRKIVGEAIDSEPKYARGAALMDAGLRSGEAAAALPMDMYDTGRYIVMNVQAQETDKKRNLKLKSKAAYRPVPLDEWQTNTIRRCSQKIETEERYEDPEKAPLEGGKLSAWVKRALIDAGCDGDFMAAVYRHMLLYPETDADGKEVDDISAHVLRRHRATMQATIMGYTRKEMEVTLGHEVKITEAEKQSFKTREVQDRLAYKNSRYDIMSQISGPSSFSLLKLQPGDELELKPLREILIENASLEPQEFSIEMDATVIGETIYIVFDGTIQKCEKRSSCTAKDMKYQNTDIIGNPWDYIEMENIIKGDAENEEE